MVCDPVELAQRLIRQESVTPARGAVFNETQKILESLGFTCHRLPFGEGAELVDNLYARRGTSSPHFCFAGHLDVVPPGDVKGWRYPPYGAEIHDGMLYGRGAEDMKGAIACFIAAAAQVQAKGSISLLLTGDEEGVGTYGTVKMLEWLKTHHEVPDVCIVGEPTNPEILGEMVKIGRRGSMNSEVIVKGVQGHVAYPQLADNPVTRLVEILHQLKSKVLDEGSEFFPPSNLEVTSIDVGNPSVNVIPAQASARFNIRFNDKHHSEELKRWIAEVCHAAGGSHVLNVRVSGEAFLTPPGALSDLVSGAVNEVTGKQPVLSTTGGTSDARFIRHFCPVVEFGTTGRTAHKTDECVAVADLHKLTEIYRVMLERYFAS